MSEVHPSRLDQQLAELLRRTHEAAQGEDLAAAAALVDELDAMEGSELDELTPAGARNLLDVAGQLIFSRRFESLHRLFMVAIRTLEEDGNTGLLGRFPPYFNLSVLYKAAGDHEARGRVLNTLLSMAEQVEELPDAHEARVLLELAGIFLESGHREPALVFFGLFHRYWSQLEHSGPKADLTWPLRYGYELLQVGRHEQAGEVYGDALQRAEALGEPGLDWRICFLGCLGNLGLVTRDFDGGDRALVAAIELADAARSDGDAAGAAYHNMATLILQKRDPARLDEARRCARRALEILERRRPGESAEYADARALLAQIAEQQGELEEAEREFRTSTEVLSRVPDATPARHTEYLADLGFVRLRRGHPQEAAAAFRAALELTDSSPGEAHDSPEDARANLAIAHHEAGDFAPSSELFEQTCRLRLQKAGLVQT